LADQTFAVEDDGFAVGDMIIIERPTTAEWLIDAHGRSEGDGRPDVSSFGQTGGASHGDQATHHCRRAA
jgi:hypothetical protein